MVLFDLPNKNMITVLFPSDRKIKVDHPGKYHTSLTSLFTGFESFHACMSDYIIYVNDGFELIEVLKNRHTNLSGLMPMNRIQEVLDISTEEFMNLIFEHSL